MNFDLKPEQIDIIKSRVHKESVIAILPTDFSKILTDRDHLDFGHLGKLFLKRCKPTPNTIWQRASAFLRPAISIPTQVPFLHDESSAWYLCYRWHGTSCHSARFAARLYVVQQNPTSMDPLLEVKKVAEATAEDSVLHDPWKILQVINCLEQCVANTVDSSSSTSKNVSTARRWL